jgi:hypothetical protein
VSPDDPTDGDGVTPPTDIEHVVDEEDPEPPADADRAQVDLNTEQWDDE